MSPTLLKPPTTHQLCAGRRGALPVGRQRLLPVAAYHAVRHEQKAPAAGPSAAERLGRGLLAAAAAATLVLSGPVGGAEAVSGGKGLSKPISGEDYSKRDLREYNFTKAVMRQTNFTGSNLSGVSLFGALAVGANFTGADLSNADLESVTFEDADLTNAILTGAYVNNAQFALVKTIQGSDWTDVLLRRDIQKELCKIASGTNPITGVDTRESLNCP